jgi:hypothetical protein
LVVAIILHAYHVAGVAVEFLNLGFRKPADGNPSRSAHTSRSPGRTAGPAARGAEPLARVSRARIWYRWLIGGRVR